MRHPIIRAAFVVAVSLAPAATYAADLKPVYKAPPPVVTTYNWTGWYIGGNVGYAWADADVGWHYISGFDAAAAIAGRETVSNQTFKLDGFTGGGQAGFNWQVGAWVFGIEADANYFSESASTTALPIPGFPGNHLSQSVSLKNLFTARGRIGYAWDRTLIYATGGWAGTDIDTFDASQYPASSQSVSGSDFLSGWTVGGGIEWAFGNGWSVKAEYLYADFGNFQTTSCNNVFPNLCYTHDHDVTMQVVRAGLNYKFGWSKAPVVAKY